MAVAQLEALAVWVALVGEAREARLPTPRATLILITRLGYRVLDLHRLRIRQAALLQMIALALLVRLTLRGRLDTWALTLMITSASIMG